MSRIIDTFCFFNEFDLLEARLEYLYNFVDYFVICESTLTQSGNSKPLYYIDNKDRYTKYSDKIISLVVDDTPLDFNVISEDPIKESILKICRNYSHYPHNVWRYENETYQKECILRKLKEICKDDDVILFSDVDEIPNIETLESLVVPYNTHINLVQDMFQYYIDVKKDEEWFGTRIFRWYYVKNFDIGLNGLRVYRDKGIKIYKGGWHLTFLGGIDKIKEKIKAYGHQEFNNDFILSNIEYRVANNLDIFFRPDKYYNIVLEDYYTKELLDILKRYPDFIKPH